MTTETFHGISNNIVSGIAPTRYAGRWLAVAMPDENTLEILNGNSEMTIVMRAETDADRAFLAAYFETIPQEAR